MCLVFAVVDMNQLFLSESSYLALFKEMTYKPSLFSTSLQLMENHSASPGSDRRIGNKI